MKKKRIVVKTVAAISGTLLVLSVCALDSASWVPTIVCFLSMGVLALCGRKLGWMEMPHD